MMLSNVAIPIAADEVAQLWAAVVKAARYAPGENVCKACCELHAISIFLLAVDPAELAAGLPRCAPFYSHLDSIVEALNTESVMKAVLLLEASVDGKKLRQHEFN